MKKGYSNYKCLKLEVLQCPKCKNKIFTEELTKKALAKLEEQRLKEKYERNAIIIGHSLGMTYPKDIVKVFNLNKDTKFRIQPNIIKGTIEISIK
jgi:hypothetical protein